MESNHYATNYQSDLRNTTEYLTNEATHLGSSESSSAYTTRRDPLYLVIPVTIIYLSIFLTGTIGNVSTCIVITRNKSMHTATNYYLFSLAVSDLLLLISGLPAEVYLVWSKYPYIFGEGFCVLRGLAAECSTNASVLTITAFTVERYVAICHPFLSHTMSKLSRAIKLILVIWLIALCFAIPQALQFGILQMPNESPDFIICTLKSVFIQHSFELSTILFFIMPMIIITVLYILIGLKLRKTNIMKKTNMRSQRGGPANKRLKDCRHHTGKSSRRVLKMLVAVVIAFFICWAPFHVQRLIAIYGTGKDGISSKTKWFEVLYYIFTYISGVLYYVSTTINPILYNIMSHKFRQAFMETLGTSCGGSSFFPHPEQRSYSSLSRSQQRAADPSEITAAVESSKASCSLGLSEYSNHHSRTCISTTKLNSKDTRRKITPNRTGTLVSTQLSSSSKNEIPLEPNSDPRLDHNNQSTIRNDDKNDNNDKRRQKNYVGMKKTREERRKKWWRFFKWIPGKKVFKLNSRTVSLTEGITDVEGKREEYSMTTCYVTKEHRFV
ncbi:pyrokinin-1 receptor-like isoform X2 [Diachasmimorpha longicaudata]|uniref:pyrokinin-1 receptor-like isoform X2 n=1 Tax=Diachasmimorpha longicaudata TaxID=58733 RepID=UPI0030B8C9AA